MKLARGSRKSIRYSIFIGVLAGSVFSGSGAFAEPLTQANFYSEINLNLSGTFELGGDIDITSVVHTDDGDGNIVDSAPTGDTVFGTFTGILDGGGFTISGLSVPLFDIIGGDGSAGVSNLILETSTAGVSGNGALANSTYLGTTIENIQVLGDVTGITENVGGLVGSFSGNITNSSVTGTVIGINTVGGLVGVSSGDVTGSTFTGTVQGERYVGGLAGVTGSTTISNSSASGTVTGLLGDDGNIGGLVGGGSGTITNSTSSVAVTGYAGTSNIGGLIGYADVNVQIIDSSSSGTVTGGSNVGGLAGQISGSLISNSFASGDVNGEAYVGGLVGYAIFGGPYSGSARGFLCPEGGSCSLPPEIENTFSTGSVYSTGDYVGGLVGYTEGNISNLYSHVNGSVTGNSYVGGLAGQASGNISNSYSYVSAGIAGNYYVGGLAGYAADDITNSYSLIDGNVEGNGSVGGLVGSMDGVISNSYSRILGSVIGENDYVGGLVGYADSSISNSYAHVTGDVNGANDRVGGLSGLSYGDISNSHAIVEGTVSGRLDVGGFVGFINFDVDITNSYFRGNVSGSNDYDGYFVGGFVGGGCSGCTISDSYSTGEVTIETLGVQNVFAGNSYVSEGLLNSCAGEITNGLLTCTDGREAPIVPISEIGANIESSAAFAIDACLNTGNPYIVSLLESYESSCNGGGGTPPPTRRDRIEREFREVLETRTPEKIEKLDGFKKEAQLVKDAAVTFVEPTEKIELTKVKAVEITATANVRVNAKADEALQISLKSESKEPVELWIKSPDGKWLLAGVITFDKDGKAILPPLKFKNVGNYSLVLSKPSADSAKGSAPLDQTGSLLVAVS